MSASENQAQASRTADACKALEIHLKVSGNWAIAASR